MIEISHARVNNLKDVSVNIPRNKFVVIAGVSGSGKSSLAFDTLYAEGQRRYVESLSSYARQFLGRMSKPECDYIKGLPPAIAIEQKVISRNPRSTVGTTTEIYEYLRLLFARIGRTFSPISGQEVKKHSVEDIISCMSGYQKGTRFIITAPLHIPAERTLKRQLEMSIQAGYARLYIDNEVIRIDDYIERIEKKSEAEISKEAHDIELLIDRVSVDTSTDMLSRITDSVETAFYEGHGVCNLVFMPAMIKHTFSVRFEADGMTFEEPTDNMFSFNSPVGACPECEGFGKIIGIDERLVIPNPSLSVYDGCVQCWHGEKMKEWLDEFCRRAAKDDFPIFEPYYNLSPKHKEWLWHGLPSDKGIDHFEKICIDSFFQMVRENQYKIQYRVMLSRYRGRTICPSCRGTRLKKEASYVRIGADQNGNGGKNIMQLVEMPINELQDWFLHLQLTEHEENVAKRLLTEINSRLKFLMDVGLGYLCLNRPSNTLSGGESQRINLCTSLGSSLVGSLYILDEPSIGLHSRDTDRLIKVLRQLQDLGNTVVVVEHDEEILRASDYLIDVGPDAGRNGGEIVFAGPIESAINQSTSKDTDEEKISYTVRYLSHAETIDIPSSRRRWNEKIVVKSPHMNNLKGNDVEIPLNVMTVVTGVSGSGKSSLVKGILYPALKRSLGEVCDAPGEYGGLEGSLNSIKHVEFVDQNPIGKSSRSNPATYVKAYDAIRQLMAEQPLAKQMGFTAQHFSFNTEGGRCEECKGAGYITVEMQFMADLELQCEECHGQRFKRDVLEVRYKDKNIFEILDMTINQAIQFFSSSDDKNLSSTKQKRSTPRTSLENVIITKLKPLQDVGLGYIKLGQNSSTLSGGENQRVKLGYFIGQEKQDRTMFIFDEPTTGLHFHDIQRLLNAFDALISRGHTILIIEHNMDVIKCADHIIDLGPEGGDKGGKIVGTGTPEEVSACEKSVTGKFLKEKLT